LPTTPYFMDYDAVYLPTNHIIKAESMSVMDYTMLFFPFEKPDFQKSKDETRWNVNNDRVMLAIATTFSNAPMTMNMSLQREYAENFDWFAMQFKDWAFMFVSSFLYYGDYDKNR